jgi:hypothetical protein
MILNKSKLDRESTDTVKLNRGVLRYSTPVNFSISGHQTRFSKKKGSALSNTPQHSNKVFNTSNLLYLYACNYKLFQSYQHIDL